MTATVLALALPLLVAATGRVCKTAGWPTSRWPTPLRTWAKGARALSLADCDPDTRARRRRERAERRTVKHANRRRVTYSGTGVLWAAGLKLAGLAVVAGLLWVLIGVALSVIASVAWLIITGTLVLPHLVGLLHRLPGKVTNPLADGARHRDALCVTFPTKLGNGQERDGTPVVIRPKLTVDETTGDQSVTYMLPKGVTVGDLTRNLEAFVGNLNLTGVPLARWFAVEAGEVRRVRVGFRGVPPDLTPRAPQWVGYPTRWSTPVVIGRDARTGRDVTAPTFDVPGWLTGGQPGYGKTVGMRLPVAHYASDPDAILWGVDGKDSATDWGSSAPGSPGGSTTTPTRT